MAANLLKVGNDPNSAIKTFCVDTIEEIAKLPTIELTLLSVGVYSRGFVE